MPHFISASRTCRYEPDGRSSAEWVEAGGSRIVARQRFMQVAGDIFLGRSRHRSRGSYRDFLVRELWGAKGLVDLETIGVGWTDLDRGALCGTVGVDTTYDEDRHPIGFGGGCGLDDLAEMLAGCGN